MNLHPITLEQLIAYAAGELPSEDYSLIASHITGCPDCSRTVSNLRAIRSALKPDGTVAPPTMTLSNAYAIFSNESPHLTARPKRGWLYAAHLAPQFKFFVLLVILTLLILMDEVVAKAQEALPGDLLYSVKTGVEQIQLDLTPANAKAKVQLDLAQRRLAEISALADEGRYQEIPGAADAFASHVQEATHSLDAANPEADPDSAHLAQQVSTALVKYARVLNDLSQSSPPQLKPALDRAKQVSMAERQAVEKPTRGAPPTQPALIPPLVPTQIEPSPTSTGAAPVAPAPPVTFPTPALEPTQPKLPSAVATPEPPAAARPRPGPLAPTATHEHPEGSSVPPEATNQLPGSVQPAAIQPNDMLSGDIQSRRHPTTAAAARPTKETTPTETISQPQNGPRPPSATPEPSTQVLPTQLPPKAPPPVTPPSATLVAPSTPSIEPTTAARPGPPQTLASQAAASQSGPPTLPPAASSDATNSLDP